MSSEFNQIASQLIIDWAKSEYISLYIALAATVIFVFKIYPWIMDIWDRIHN